MIDPFFYDRLMHVFTTANSTPLSQTAAHAAPGQPEATSAEATTCRALREAEAVVAAVLLREPTAQPQANQADDHALGG